MPQSQQTHRMRDALLRARTRIAAGARRTWGAIRRHPWRTAFALPALLLLYVGALYPFTPSIGDIRKAKLEQPSVVLTADGKELAVFKRANRDWVKLQDVSPNVMNALLATEDHRFYAHTGFDFKRTAKAALNTLRGERQGGSTITQQLARNLYPEKVGRAPTIHRKVKELITALKIEAVYTKDEILETYLNTVPFLYNAYGIEMAAQTYFDKPAKNLDVVEAATLVGMLKGTSMYNPVLNPDRALQRRNTVLAQMVKHGKLQASQFEPLAKKPLKLDFERQPEFGGPAPHLAQNIRRWLIDWADRNDYNIHADGLVVHTSIDSRLQAMANQAVARQGEVVQAVADVEWGRAGGGLSTDPSAYAAQQGKIAPFEHYWNTHKKLLDTFLRESAAYQRQREAGLDDEQALHKLKADEAFMKSFKREKTRVQAGFLAVDPSNGHVKAWVGSRDYQDDKFDHVQQARRQPGSTFKPFVYGAAFESGARPTDTYVDQPVEIRVDRNQVWRPGDVGDYTGQPMTLRDGLVKSKNTITAQVMQQVGPARVASLARAMGVRHSRLDEVPSLALGTSPVTLREMVTSYAAIANGGSYIEPIVVLRVEDREGNVLEEFHPAAPERAVSNETAQTLLDVMRGVIDEGTAVGLRHRFGIQADVAGKTGTTQNNTDGWFVLMHPNLVAGAWMGFNDARVTMRSEYWGQGSHNALFVVGDFLQQSFKAKALDAKATFAVPKNSSKGTPPGMLDSIWGRANDWWNSMWGGSSGSGTETAAVVQPAPLPPLPAPPKPEPLPEPMVLPEPMRLPETGALPPGPGRAPETVLGAPAARAPDAVIPAPSTLPAVPSPSWPSAARVEPSLPAAAARTTTPVPGGRARMAQPGSPATEPAQPLPQGSEPVTIRQIEPVVPGESAGSAVPRPAQRGAVASTPAPAPVQERGPASDGGSSSGSSTSTSGASGASGEARSSSDASSANAVQPATGSANAVPQE